MFIRLILLSVLLYCGYLGIQAEPAEALGGLAHFQEWIVALVVAVLATPLIGKLLH